MVLGKEEVPRLAELFDLFGGNDPDVVLRHHA